VGASTSSTASSAAARLVGAESDRKLRSAAAPTSGPTFDDAELEAAAGPDQACEVTKVADNAVVAAAAANAIRLKRCRLGGTMAGTVHRLRLVEL